MARIRIDDLPENLVVTKKEMRSIAGGYVDKTIMEGSAIPDNPFGYGDEPDDSGSGDTGTGSGTTFTFPDVCKLPTPSSGPVPLPYPNISCSKK